jgi:glycosyltransferase involved in cell wall biosynthesis
MTNHPHRKRVLICSPSHTVHGGVEIIVGDLCRQLPRYGWEAILGLGKGACFNDVERYRRAYPDVPSVEIEGSKGTRQSRKEALLRVIKRLRPNLVLIARLFDAYGVVTHLKSKYGKPRLAVTIQAYEPHYLFDALLYQEQIDLCVTSGNLIREAAIGWSGLPAERVVSIPGGVEPPRAEVSVRRPGEVLKLGYVGRVEAAQKRIFDLVDLLLIMEKQKFRYTLDIIGTGPAEGELRERLRPLVLAKKVTFHGWQDHRDLYGRFFPSLDCLVHFAFTEGVTIAPREAMAHGVVPVISEFWGLKTERQFVNHVNALTFPVGDVEAAARCIERLVKEEGLMQSLSERAMSSQHGVYSAEGAMRAWGAAFDQCLDQPVRKGGIPRLAFSPDGRLARWGLPPWFAQRIRDLLGRRHLHSDPGSEWPTGSGLMTAESAEAIKQFGEQVERRAQGAC